MAKGRPKSTDNRDIQFRVRLTKEEYELLDNMSKETGKTKSEILRGVLDMNGATKVVKNGMVVDEFLGVKIKYFSDQIDKLEYIEGDKSDWIDLRAAEEVELKAGESKLIKLGIGMILPKGCEAHMLPRSSTYKQFGITMTNSMGIIDESFCGEKDQWRFPALAHRDTVIHVNDRIAQFRIVEKMPRVEFTEVDHLNEVSRGGIGTTGRN